MLGVVVVYLGLIAAFLGGAYPFSGLCLFLPFVPAAKPRWS